MTVSLLPGAATQRKPRVATAIARGWLRSRYPEADGAPEAELRAGLARVVLEGATPDARQTALLAVLHGAGLHKLVFPDVDQKAVNRRMEELADGQ